MNDDITDRMLDRYLAGECEPADIAAIEAWIAADPARAVAFAALRAAMGRETAGPRWDVDVAWARLDERVGDSAPAGGTDEGAIPTHARGGAPPPTGSAASRGNAIPRRANIGWPAAPWKLAAMVATLLFAALTLWRLVAPGEADIPAVATVATTPAGQQDTVDLPDGSRVILAPASRLAVQADFGEADRTVRLDGEAFFDVSPDPARPFRIDASDSRVIVVGTEFVVSARADSVTVAVREGRVRLGPALSRAAELELVAGEVGRMRRGGQPARLALPADSWLAWLGGTLDFDEGTLADVAARLEAWYGVRIRIDDEALRMRRITGRFQTKSLPAVLDAITLSLNARWEERNGEYVLHVPRNPERRP